MGVASGRGYQDIGVASGWNLWVWLECIGVVIIIISFSYSTCISSFFGSSIPISLFISKMCFRSLIYQLSVPLRCPVRAGCIKVKATLLWTTLYYINI